MPPAPLVQCLGADPRMNAMSMAAQRTGWLTPHWSNWRLALVAAAIVIPLALFGLPPQISFWVALLAVVAVAVTAVVNAWGACQPLPAVCPADLDRDSNVAVPDLLVVINNWHTYCPNCK